MQKRARINGFVKYSRYTHSDHVCGWTQIKFVTKFMSRSVKISYLFSNTVSLFLSFITLVVIMSMSGILVCVSAVTWAFIICLSLTLVLQSSVPDQLVRFSRSGFPYVMRCVLYLVIQMFNSVTCGVSCLISLCLQFRFSSACILFLTLAPPTLTCTSESSIQVFLIHSSTQVSLYPLVSAHRSGFKC